MNAKQMQIYAVFVLRSITVIWSVELYIRISRRVMLLIQIL